MSHLFADYYTCNIKTVIVLFILRYYIIIASYMNISKNIGQIENCYKLNSLYTLMKHVLKCWHTWHWQSNRNWRPECYGNVESKVCKWWRMDTRFIPIWLLVLTYDTFMYSRRCTVCYVLCSFLPSPTPNLSVPATHPHYLFSFPPPIYFNFRLHRHLSYY